MKEDRILEAYLEDKILQCEEQYRVTNSYFLDMRQQTVAEQLFRHKKGLQYTFYGGYEDAERRVAVFFPDYIHRQDCWPQGWDDVEEEDEPLAVLRLTKSKGSKELSHRDYLGSLMGMGIKRESVGDILVWNDGCDVVVLKEMAEFLLHHYDKAGRVSLEAEIYQLKDIRIPPVRTEEVRDTVASLRIDNIAASAFSLSRTKAVDAIASGLVFVNGRQRYKSDALVNQGDKVVLRGKGKVVLKEVGEPTRKGRLPVTILRYV